MKLGRNSFAILLKDFQIQATTTSPKDTIQGASTQAHQDHLYRLASC